MRTWNMDSAAKSPPIPTPYSPPARPSSSHASTEWAQPSACSRVYAATMSESIQLVGSPGRAHAATTKANAVSTRIS